MYSEQMLLEAAGHGRDNHAELARSKLGGCFYCESTFAPSAIERWLNEGDGTAVCPECQIDSVIGDASGLPVAAPEFLAAMRRRWFE